MNSETMTFMILIAIAIFTAIITIYLLNKQSEHYSMEWPYDTTQFIAQENTFSSNPQYMG